MQHTSNLELQSLVNQFLAHHGGGIIFLCGMEGSGKSDIGEALQTAAPDKVAPIFFSKALDDHLTRLEGGFSKKARAASTGHDLIGWVEEARQLMAERKKNIHPHLVTGALYSATRTLIGNVVSGHPGKLLIVDGFPRLENQPGMITNIFSEFFQAQPSMMIEADCPRTIAYQRALSRGKPTDTPENLTAAHDEYARVMPKVVAKMKTYADHLKVHAGTTKEAKMNDFVRTLSGHLAHIHQHGFATVTGQRSRGTRPVVVLSGLGGLPGGGLVTATA